MQNAVLNQKIRHFREHYLLSSYIISQLQYILFTV